MDHDLLESVTARLLEIARRCVLNPRVQSDLIELAQDLLERLESRPAHRQESEQPLTQ